MTVADRIAEPMALTPEEKQLVVLGRHIDAQRAYRARTGCGLLEARRAVMEAHDRIVAARALIAIKGGDRG